MGYKGIRNNWNSEVFLNSLCDNTGLKDDFLCPHYKFLDFYAGIVLLKNLTKKLALNIIQTVKASQIPCSFIP